MRLRSPELLPLLLAAIFVVTSVWLGARGSTHNPLQSAVAQPSGQVTTIPPDKTAPIWRRMTPAQKEHARVFAEFQGQARIIDNGVSVHRFTTDVLPSNPLPAKTLYDAVKDLKCSVDAVFEGRVVSGESFPTEDGTFLFTDYRVTIDRVFRSPSGPSGSHLEPNQDVVVARPGGALIVDGKSIEATVDAFPALETGRTYLLFVKYLPAYRSFQTANSKGALAVEDAHLRALRPLQPWDRETTKGGLSGDEVRNILSGAECSDSRGRR